MALGNAIVELAFRYSIFSLLIYKLYDIGKRYFLPYVNDQVKQEEQSLAELLEKEKIITSTHLRIKNQIQRQNLRFQTLEKNVQQWHASMYTLKNECESEQRRIMQLVYEKRHKQNQRMLIQKNAIVAIPEALSLAHKELDLLYTGENGKKFLKDIIKTSIAKK